MLQVRSLALQGWGLSDLPLHASNESLLRPRVARAQKIISLIPFSHFLKISLGSVIFPIETATSSHPFPPNSFSTVCIFWRRQFYWVTPLCFLQCVPLTLHHFHAHTSNRQ